MTPTTLSSPTTRSATADGPSAAADDPSPSSVVGEVPTQGGRAPLDPDRELRRLEVIHRRALAAGRRRRRRVRLRG